MHVDAERAAVDLADAQVHELAQPLVERGARGMGELGAGAGGLGGEGVVVETG